MPDLPSAIEADIDKLVEVLGIGALTKPRDRLEAYLGKGDLAVIKSQLQNEMQSDRGKRRFEIMRANRAVQTKSSHEKVLERARTLIHAGTPQGKLVAETARKNPGYSARQIRRILSEAGILRPKK